MQCNFNVDTLPSRDSLQQGMCPVAWALDCVSVARENNCGKNVMCRDGMTQLKVILTDIIAGHAEDGDLDLIREICKVITTTPGCDIAETAAANVLWCMDTYAAEWQNHLRKRCSTFACFYDVIVDPALCTGCGKCPGICKVGAIQGGQGLISVVKAFRCNHCGECFAACEAKAIVKCGPVKPNLPAAPVPVGSCEVGGGRRRARRGGEAAASAPAAPITSAAAAPAPIPAAQETPAAAPAAPVFTAGERPQHVRRRRIPGSEE